MTFLATGLDVPKSRVRHISHLLAPEPMVLGKAEAEGVMARQWLQVGRLFCCSSVSERSRLQSVCAHTKLTRLNDPRQDDLQEASRSPSQCQVASHPAWGGCACESGRGARLVRLVGAGGKLESHHSCATRRQRPRQHSVEQWRVEPGSP